MSQIWEGGKHPLPLVTSPLFILVIFGISFPHSLLPWGPPISYACRRNMAFPSSAHKKLDSRPDSLFHPLSWLPMPLPIFFFAKILLKLFINFWRTPRDSGKSFQFSLTVHTPTHNRVASARAAGNPGCCPVDPQIGPGIEVEILGIVCTIFSVPVFHFTKEAGEHILGDSRSLYVAAFSPTLALSLHDTSWFLFLTHCPFLGWRLQFLFYHFAEGCGL